MGNYSFKSHQQKWRPCQECGFYSQKGIYTVLNFLDTESFQNVATCSFFYFKIHSVILSFSLLVCLFLSLFLLETTCVFLNWQTWPLSYTRYISETDLTFISVLLFPFSLLGSIPWKSLYFINMYEKHQEMNSLSFSSCRYLYFFLYSMTSFPSESLNLYSVRFYNHVVTVPLFWSL